MAAQGVDETVMRPVVPQPLSPRERFLLPHDLVCQLRRLGMKGKAEGIVQPFPLKFLLQFGGQMVFSAEVKKKLRVGDVKAQSFRYIFAAGRGFFHDVVGGQGFGQIMKPAHRRHFRP